MEERVSPRALLRPHRAHIAALLALSLAVSAIALLQPWFTKLLIDDALLGRDLPLLLLLAATMLGLGVLGTLLGGLNRYQYTRLSGRILFTLRERVYAHLQRLSPAFFVRNRSGDILSRLDGDVAEIQRFALDSLFAAISGVFGLLGTVGFMLWLSPSLSLVAAVLIPLQWLWLRSMRVRVRSRTMGLRERAADVSSFLVETLPAMKTIQAAAATAREHARLARLNRGYLDALLRLQLTEFATAAVPANLSTASRALVFVVGGTEVIEGRLALGSLIAFISYLGMAMGPVQSLLGVYMGYNRVRVSLERVQHLTAAEPEVNPTGTRAPPAQGAVEIRLEDLGFGHHGANGAVLQGVNLCIPAGARVGIYGPSGSGKSTLVDLLLRHFDPERGCIRVNGTDLRELDLSAWRRRVALVAQDTVLFRGSLRDNVRYLRPESDDAAVREALSRAQLGELLARLPEGLDTAIGERGARLSGGERQRLAIARALLQDPLLVVFDEATSAVDADAERALMREVEALFPGTTRLFISHREAPLAEADLLLEVRDGGVRVIAP